MPRFTLPRTGQPYIYTSVSGCIQWAHDWQVRFRGGSGVREHHVDESLFPDCSVYVLCWTGGVRGPSGDIYFYISYLCLQYITGSAPEAQRCSSSPPHRDLTWPDSPSHTVHTLLYTLLWFPHQATSLWIYSMHDSRGKYRSPGNIVGTWQTR